MKVIIVNTETKEQITTAPAVNIEENMVDKPYPVYIEPGQSVQILDKDDNVIDERSCEGEEGFFVNIQRWKFCNQYVMDWDKVETAEEFFQILKSKPFRWELKLNLLEEDWDAYPEDVKKYFDQK